ncbi:MAG: arsenate reductase ArsC [Ignavibacteria bacterium]|nr:arsenate reductase ArsC [Ignavibacteria bacterium]
MEKRKALFICIHNSARSQMAEAFLNHLAGEKFEAHSAGIEPGKLNPLVVKSMSEIGIDISGKGTQSVFDVYERGEAFDYVIAVCDKEAAEKCPVFPGVTKRLQWSFNDPSKLEGSEEEKLKKIAMIRDEIKASVSGFIKENSVS